MAVISYDVAIRHLRQIGVLDGSPEDDDVNMKIEQASAIVVLYLKRPAEWDIDSLATDDPEFAIVQAAVLKVLGNLYRFRGDDDVAPAPISPDVALMLNMLRDPEFSGP